MSNDTIVAVATPPGQGGVGVVRLSGKRAYSIALQLTQKEALKPRYTTYCSVVDKMGEVVDQGLVLFFKAPASFTGEDVIELQLHGSPVVLDEVISRCIELGCRIANPGEFSERAFLNNKMDLTQAEAIADLIGASSKSSAQMAVRSLQGEFSKRISALNTRIVHLRMYVEAAIDFPEEEIDFLSDGKVLTQLQAILTSLKTIRENTSQGVIMREGLTVVIAGKPNAGKSTLINALAQKDVAIVTDIPGTTRDVMREHVMLDEIPIHIVDTAGLRESDDDVEKQGIQRAWHELSLAHVVLMVVDGTENDDSTELKQSIVERLPNNTPIITVVNKLDKLDSKPEIDAKSVCISAKTHAGLNQLKEKIKAVTHANPQEGIFLARRRHLNAIDQAQQLLLTGQKQLEEHHAGELLAEDLRQAHQHLAEITGEFSSDDLLGEIFSSFCIGK